MIAVTVKTKRIVLDWDSGPFASFFEQPQASDYRAYGRRIVDIPETLWADYEAAQERVMDLENKIQEYCKE